MEEDKKPQRSVEERLEALEFKVHTLDRLVYKLFQFRKEELSA